MARVVRLLGGLVVVVMLAGLGIMTLAGRSLATNGGVMRLRPFAGPPAPIAFWSPAIALDMHARRLFIVDPTIRA